MALSKQILFTLCCDFKYLWKTPGKIANLYAPVKSRNLENTKVHKPWTDTNSKLFRYKISQETKLKQIVEKTEGEKAAIKKHHENVIKVGYPDSIWLFISFKKWTIWEV